MFLYFSTPPISHGRQEGAVDTLAALLEAHADDIDNGMLQQGLGTCHIDEHTHSKHTYTKHRKRLQALASSPPPVCQTDFAIMLTCAHTRAHTSTHTSSRRVGMGERGEEACPRMPVVGRTDETARSRSALKALGVAIAHGHVWL